MKTILNKCWPSECFSASISIKIWTIFFFFPSLMMLVYIIQLKNLMVTLISWYTPGIAPRIVSALKLIKYFIPYVLKFFRMLP